MDINEKDKKNLRKEALKWKKFIKKHMKEFRCDRPDVHAKDSEALFTMKDYHGQYHIGEISFIDFFFDLTKNKKHGRKKSKKTAYN